MADADAAVCMGPGLRWALMGPNLIYHLGGGPGGIRHFFDLSVSRARWRRFGLISALPKRVEKFCRNFIWRKITGDITAECLEAEVGRHRQEPVPWIHRVKHGKPFRHPRTTGERRAHLS